MPEGNCHDCGTFRKWLHKHHLKLQVEGGTDADGVVMICANCHEDRHAGPCGGVTRGRAANSPTARAKKSKKSKAMWADPKIRKKILESRAEARTSGRRDDKEIGRKIRSWWTPERRAAHAVKVSRGKRKKATEQNLSLF